MLLIKLRSIRKGDKVEDLKILIEAIAGLPTLAIWVIAMYFFFKIAIIGSIFGVVRLITLKVWDYFKTKKESKEVVREIVRDSYNVYDVNLGKNCIKGVEEELFVLFKDMQSEIRNKDSYKYIHHSNVKELSDFFEEYKKQKKDK